MEDIFHKVVVPMISSPVLGFTIGFIFMGILFFLIRNWRPNTVNSVFGKLQILSAGYMGFGHGLADAQKTFKKHVEPFMKEYCVECHGDKKTKVWSTTIGHNNETVADAKYLDLVTRGILWSTGKIGADGKVAAGYGAVKAAVK